MDSPHQRIPLLTPAIGDSFAKLAKAEGLETLHKSTRWFTPAGFSISTRIFAWFSRSAKNVRPPSRDSPSPVLTTRGAQINQKAQNRGTHPKWVPRQSMQKKPRFLNFSIVKILGENAIDITHYKVTKRVTLELKA